MATARNFDSLGGDVFLAALAGVGVIELFSWLIGQWALFGMSDSWSAEYPTLAVVVPFVTIAFVVGFVIGIVVGATFRERALRVAVWTGLGLCFISFGAALFVGGVEFVTSTYSVLSAPLEAAGMLVGTLAGRGLRHA